MPLLFTHTGRNGVLVGGERRHARDRPTTAPTHLSSATSQRSERVGPMERRQGRMSNLASGGADSYAHAQGDPNLLSHSHRHTSAHLRRRRLTVQKDTSNGVACSTDLVPCLCLQKRSAGVPSHPRFGAAGPRLTTVEITIQRCSGGRSRCAAQNARRRDNSQERMHFLVLGEAENYARQASWRESGVCFKVKFQASPSPKLALSGSGTLQLNCTSTFKLRQYCTVNRATTLQ